MQKRFFSIILALIMALPISMMAFVISASADETKTGNWITDNSGSKYIEEFKAEFKVSRTDNTATIKITWTDTIYAGYYDTYRYAFSVDCNGKSTGIVTVVPANTWKNDSSASSKRSKSATANLTVSLSTTGSTSVSAVCKQYQYNSNGTLLNTETKKPGTVSIAIPAMTYTIKYDANDGSGAPASQTKTGAKALTLSSSKPTRSGYTFQGWATSSSATSAEYQPGGTYKTDKGVTLYAVWNKDLETYTVKYDANGGSNAPASQTKTEGTALTLSSSKPTRSGYTFRGWATGSSDTSADYQPGDTYKADKNVTLYAVWKKNLETYTVKYDANGGTDAPSSQTKTEGTALTLSSSKPIRSGYSFAGWATSSSDTTADYLPGGTYKADKSVTLYAVWKKNLETYTIKYDANGGSNAPSSQTKTEGTALILSSSKPTRSGYTFVGWATSSGADTADYLPGETYSVNSSDTLYAVWKKEPETYTIKYDANGGTDAPSSQTKTEGTALTLSSSKPTRSGYTFKGWATSSSASSAEYLPGETYYENTSDTLYAVWTQNDTEDTNSKNSDAADSDIAPSEDISSNDSEDSISPDTLGEIGVDSGAAISEANGNDEENAANPDNVEIEGNGFADSGKKSDSSDSKSKSTDTGNEKMSKTKIIIIIAVTVAAIVGIIIAIVLILTKTKKKNSDDI